LRYSLSFEIIDQIPATVAKNIMRKVIKEIDEIIPLNVPVPPMLSKAMGYKGEARFVSFHWMHKEVEVEYSDGRIKAIASDMPYFNYIQHRAVKPYLKAYDLGYPRQREATHALILDREKLKLSIAPVKAAEVFLKQQPQPVRNTQQEFIAISTNALCRRTSTRMRPCNGGLKRISPSLRRCTGGSISF
jgi:hypothetical protein